MIRRNTVHENIFMVVNYKKRRAFSKKPPNPLFPRILVAMRPWSFPAAVTPLFVSFTIMFKSSNLNIGQSLLFVVGILALQASANLLNSFCDYKNGLDKADTSGDRTMVDSLVTKSEFPWLLTKLNLLWFISFISTIPADEQTRFVYLVLYAIGVFLAVFYSAGSTPLKYVGLGDLSVFLAFGPVLVSAGVYCSAIEISRLDIEKILLLTTPAAILVVGILHANNHRDLPVDEQNRAMTVSVRLGDHYSKLYYQFLVLSPIVMSLLAGYYLERGAALGSLILPLSVRLIRMIDDRDSIPRDIDAETAKIMLIYGLLTSLGIAVL
jgi:1,4-dihydroxy-2-naphthoate octaprenyltransferase